MRMYIKRRVLKTDGPGSIRRFLKRPPEKPPKKLCIGQRDQVKKEPDSPVKSPTSKAMIETYEHTFQ